jgi:CDP-diacylglycerol--glycerol-3-phosphate 3-phosphatidyltransferase
MVTVVVVRELLVTGIRGMVEATGKKFGADWFGKLKMVLQCAVLIAVFLIRWWHAAGLTPSALEVLEPLARILLWLMLGATIGSGAQYVVKAVRLMSDTNGSGQPD